MVNKWLEDMEKTLVKSTDRGGYHAGDCIYLDIWHPDITNFINVKELEGSGVGVDVSKLKI